jgi:hypothetical protein
MNVMKKKAKRSGRRSPKRSASATRWSQGVTQRSNSLDLEGGVFSHDDPKDIAASLKRSAQRSKRRKGTPYQSAMSMLNFYINRAGAKLPKSRRAKLERAKSELRALFGR